MKEIVLKYGAISGLIAATMMFCTILFEKKYGMGSTPPWVGYLGMIISFAPPIYIGVKKFRETRGGVITFFKAFNIGILIVVVSGIFYSLAWLIIYYCITPDFYDKYSAYVVQQIKLSTQNIKDTAEIHRLLKDTATFKEAMMQNKELSKNPFILGALTFTEPLLPGIIISLICSVILRKKPPTIEISNLN